MKTLFRLFMLVLFLGSISLIIWFVLNDPAYSAVDHSLICQQLLAYQEDTVMASELAKYQCR
jgi:hypothetical protein